MSTTFIQIALSNLSKRDCKKMKAPFRTFEEWMELHKYLSMWMGKLHFQKVVYYYWFGFEG